MCMIAVRDKCTRSLCCELFVLKRVGLAETTLIHACRRHGSSVTGTNAIIIVRPRWLIMLAHNYAHPEGCALSMSVDVYCSLTDRSSPAYPPRHPAFPIRTRYREGQHIHCGSVFANWRQIEGQRVLRSFDVFARFMSIAITTASGAFIAAITTAAGHAGCSLGIRRDMMARPSICLQVSRGFHVLGGLSGCSAWRTQQPVLSNIIPGPRHTTRETRGTCEDNVCRA